MGSGLLGLALAAFGVKGLLALAPAGLPAIFEIGIDGSVLVFTAVISVVAGLFFGVFPVFGYGRTELANALKDGGRSSTSGRERHRARSFLAVAQVALALMLLVGSGLMLRSFVALKNIDLGFETAGLMTFSYALPGAEYAEADQVLGFHRRLMEELAARPGVQAVGMVSGLPLTDSKSAGPLEPEDNPMPEGELGPIVERRTVLPGYFEAMGIPSSRAEGRAGRIRRTSSGAS